MAVIASIWDRAAARVWGGTLGRGAVLAWDAADAYKSEYAVVVVVTAVVRVAGSRNA